MKINTLKTKIFSIATLAVLLSGCATSPSNIQAQSISPNMYQNYNCQQLADESTIIFTKIDKLKDSIGDESIYDKAAIAGSIASFGLLSPSLLFMHSDTNKEATYSLLQGEYSALKQAQVLKNCQFSNPIPSSN